jgi:hypothetical protein
VVSYLGFDGLMEIPAPFVVDYPPEWQPADPEVGRANMASWAKKTGGVEVELSGLSQKELDDPGPPTSDTIRRLLLALVILWLVEIGIRRRWLPWQS